MAEQPGPEAGTRRLGLARCTVLVLLSIAPALTLLAVPTGSRPLGLLAARVAGLVLPSRIVAAVTLTVTVLTAPTSEDPDPPDDEAREHAQGE